MRTYVVQSDGEGDYTTIQGAIDAWEADGGEPAKIIILPGWYTEQIEIGDDSKDLTPDGG